MTQEELDKIIKQHQHWLKEDCEGWEGMNANLSGANLSCVDLSGANLRHANLCCANLSNANLHDADLSDADLHYADLSDADLHDANLSDANLRGANLRDTNLYGADLSDADLHSANLSDANLRHANLYGANLHDTDLYGADLSDANLHSANLSDANLSGAGKLRLGKILTEPMTGYKKTKEGVVITAEIPAGAIVFCINGKKARTNRAKITDMGGKDVLHSQHDNSFEYRLGQEIEIKDFNLMYNVECASGFHFFMTKKEAEEY